MCSQTPILAYANYQKPFKLHTDASEHGLGVVLHQKQDDVTECVLHMQVGVYLNPKGIMIPTS